MGFEPPPWASQPCRIATLEVCVPGAGAEALPIDQKSYYVLGREPGSDVVNGDETVSKLHAAIVHHEDGRLFLIDLKSTHGTHLGGSKIPGHKPTLLKDKMEFRLGQSSVQYRVRCESSAEKRRATSLEEQLAGSKGHQSMCVQASHILVKHKDSRRPKSWKSPVIMRTQEEAMEIIKGFRELIVNGQADFKEIASTESDCSSARRGGDLGPFGPGQMQKAFEDATFALEVNELSQPVISDSGVHLILRTA
ncbi:unnamed protein product [Ostreobium quekettii]|uniref:Peptidyl-prolyl cis-trans isomerase n=1 Tax=Ostreobium quekettii TaxID=121088 RepID=A0A8S1IQG6_9CHLO|nr:unnamed protein product [Ostreobium quekettii]|eukprot:evm.model.scf_1966.2 EVM.evm.TU.scf_1966.2   scf_1966:6685-11891(-)